MTSKYPEKEPIFCSFLPGLSFEATQAVTPPLVAPRHSSSSASADFFREQDSNPDQAEREAAEAAEDDEGGDEEEDLEEEVPSPIRTFTKVVQIRLCHNNYNVSHNFIAPSKELYSEIALETIHLRLQQLFTLF